jgi:DNA-binding NarL/FixJ family response regulator
MKKTFLLFSILLVAMLGCNLSETISPSESPVPIFTDTQSRASDTPVPPTAALLETPTPLPPVFEGVEVAVDPLRLVISRELARGARGNQFPRAEGSDVAPWDITPGHITLELEGYLLQEKAHQPQVYVYPAQEYAELFPGAFESIRRLDNILYSPSAPLNAEQLPAVPFFNAAQIFASNIQVISFQNGHGVRFLTQYAQHAAPANNRELFYHFQEDELVQNALKAGTVGYLMKNVTARELSAAIRSAKEGKITLSPEAAQALVHATQQAQETDNLTEREREVLKLMVEGLNNAEIAERLVVSLSTVKYHISNILMKLGVDNRVAAVTMALQKKLV